MKIARILSAGATAILLIGSPPALAEGWSPAKLNPFAKRAENNTVSGRRHNVRSVEPSPLEKLNTGTKKFFADTNAGLTKFFADTDAGAKRFFAGAKGALTRKRPDPKRKPTNQYVPWVRAPNDPRYPQQHTKQKNSWLDSLLGREEPKRVESLKEWVGLPRPTP